MKKLPPLNALRYFVVAADTLSFKKAAEQLFVTQAAISQHIKTLESFLGLPLFVRGTRQVKLTEDGQRLLPYIKAGFESFETGVGMLQQDINPNVLNVSVVESLSSRWLVPKLQDFQEKHSDITVRLEPCNQVRSFEQTDLDLAVRFGKGNYPGLESRFLAGDKYVLVCHPSLMSFATSVKNLHKLAVLEEVGPISQAPWLAFFSQHRLDGDSFKKTLQVEDSTVTIVEAALAGQGIAMLRYSLIYEQIRRGHLMQLFEYVYPSDYSYYLVAPSHHFNKPKVKLFEQWLSSGLSEIN